MRVPTQVTSVRAVKVRPDRHSELPEHVVTEEPLEIRVAGPGQEAAPLVVTMRTPGHDFELAVGFIRTEGLADDGEIAGAGYCDAVRDDPATRFNTVTVTLTRPWVAPTTRAFTLSASCGVCGKSSIDQVTLGCPAVPPGPPVDRSVVVTLPERLRAAQRAFDRTGGLHAAGLFDLAGGLVCAREDVGRHNAVDKVAGAMVLGGRPPSAADPAAPAGGVGQVLMVTGRVSFEIVQKAAMAGFATLCAVSAPSSLAISAAESLGVGLAGFVRGDSFNIYAHPERFDLGR